VEVVENTTRRFVPEEILLSGMSSYSIINVVRTITHLLSTTPITHYSFDLLTLCDLDLYVYVLERRGEGSSFSTTLNTESKNRTEALNAPIALIALAKAKDTPTAIAVVAAPHSSETVN